MSLSRPEENEKEFFKNEFSNLINFHPHLNLQESINVILNQIEREKEKYPIYSNNKKWLHPKLINPTGKPWKTIYK
tara:strand:- start:237 stop:464 length:228 start_codon:yes stop_codon:yes gene_type:complete